MIYGDLNFSQLRYRFAVGLVRPKQAGASALATCSYEGEQLFGERRQVAIAVYTHRTRWKRDAKRAELGGQ